MVLIKQTMNRGRLRAFTMIELMVGAAILVILVVAFSTILSKLQLMVTTTQSNQRLDDMQSALSHQLGTDILSITKFGYLSVADDKLVLIRSGSFQSKEDGDVDSLLGLVCYKAQSGMLTRESKVLYGATAPGSSADDVIYEIALADLASDSTVSSGLDSEFDTAIDSIELPITSLDTIVKIENVFLLDCADVSFEAIGAVGTGPWTSGNNDEWPTAVKLTITIREQASQKNAILRQKTYEITYPIGL